MDEEGSVWVGTYADVINLIAGPLAELVAPRVARFAAPRHSVTASPRRRCPVPPLLCATCPGPPRRRSSMPPQPCVAAPCRRNLARYSASPLLHDASSRR